MTLLTRYLSFICRFSRRTMSHERFSHLDLTSKNQRGDVLCEANVIRSVYESPTIKHLTLNVSNKNLTFKPGQWVDFYVPGMRECTGYSMISTPKQMKDSSLLELAIKRSDHPITDWVHRNCEVDSKVNIRVGGDFYYNPLPSDPKTDVLFVAGGVGINPLFCMWRHLADLAMNTDGYKPGNIHLMYSVTNAEELIFQGKIREVDATFPGFTHQFYLTREAEGNIQDDDCNAGRISQSDVDTALTRLDVDNLVCYLCGPTAMIEAMADYLLSANIDPDQIKYENWF